MEVEKRDEKSSRIIICLINHLVLRQEGSSQLEEQCNTNVIRPFQSGPINKVPLTSITQSSCCFSSCTSGTSALFLLCHKYFWEFQKGSLHMLKHYPVSHNPHMASLEFLFCPTSVHATSKATLTVTHVWLLLQKDAFSNVSKASTLWNQRALNLK